MKKLYLYTLIFILILSAGCTDKPDIKLVSDGEQEELITFSIIGKDSEEILAVFAEYQDNLNAADLSEKICRIKEIPIVFSGIGSMRYVQGINDLFEFDEGAESGWIYKVNGEIMGIGCANYTVQRGDHISWHYTLDFGKDSGAEFEN